MAFFTINEKAEVITIVNYLISEGLDITVEIQGKDEMFATRAIAIEEFFEGDSLIVEKLRPEEGNSFILSAPEVVLSFDLKGRRASCITKYMGVPTENPNYGLLFELPAMVQLEEMRREKRITDVMTKILSVEFSLEDEGKKYQLSVVNLGSAGLGLIVEKKDFDLFEKINVGDRIQDITVFLPVATMNTDATVKHMTLIKEGQFRGCYLVGIESSSLMELGELQGEQEKVE
jgi:hypothetical protein